MNPKKRRVVLTILAVLAVVLLVLIIMNWRIVAEVFWLTVLATILGTTCYIVLVLKKYTSRKAAVIIAAIVSLFVMYNGLRCISFRMKMEQLEQEFVDSAIRYGPNGVTEHELDYGGRLTKILEKRDKLLHDYHYTMKGEWWVSQMYWDSGVNPEINAWYTWTLF